MQHPHLLITGQAKTTKMAKTEHYRIKAKKAMIRGSFSKSLVLTIAWVRSASINSSYQ